MSAPGGGEPPPTPLISADEAFRRLVGQIGKKPAVPSISKFVKKLDAIPEIALPEEQTIKISLALAERGLIGQFMGLCPSTKTTDDRI